MEVGVVLVSSVLWGEGLVPGGQESSWERGLGSGDVHMRRRSLCKSQSPGAGGKEEKANASQQ